MNPPAPDQTDILAANERLTADLAAAVRDRDAAQAQVTALTGERDTALRERDEARGQVAVLTGERDDARTALATVTTERDRLAGIDRDFNRRLAAELAKHGIRAEAIAPGSAAPPATDLIAQYQAITDPKEKAAFLAKHEKELRALL